ncbi:hypothetical protein bAD24_I14315 [Burkholderia sp. AD24]|nr:hypothetical protein bAD24_I14315 [Burkholderia sp. AD24]
MKTVATRTAWIVSALALASCGGEDAPQSQQQRSAAQKRASVLKPYLDQTVAWLPCDKNRLPLPGPHWPTIRAFVARAFVPRWIGAIRKKARLRSH